MSRIRRGVVSAIILGLGFVVGCSNDEGTKPPDSVDQFEVVRQAVDTYITSIASAPTVSAQYVFENLDANYEISVRKPEHFALGHLPGARNILYTEIATVTIVASLPKNQAIVTYCYTGHTGGAAATCLGTMGFSVRNMKFGMMAWTSDAAVRAQSPFTEEAYPGYPTEVEIAAHPLTTDYGLPTLDVSTSTDHAEIIRAACDAYLGRFRTAGVSPVIEASAVHARNFEDGDTSNDYFIVSVRKAEDYAKGHVTGAYNIPWSQIAKPENLAKLPHEKKIVVYCYTGHTGAIAAAALGILGYDVVNLKHGIMSWTKDASVRVQQPFTEEVDCKDYELETN